VIYVQDRRMTISFAAIEHGTLVAEQNVETAVPWWSFTKTVIATIALILVRDGRLALDGPLPKRPYTLRQLLQHRAGVPDYGNLATYHAGVASGDQPWPLSTLLERAQADCLRFEPGRGWEYSNIGYAFVRQLIEQASDESFDALLERLVLRPLDIHGPRLASVPADLDGASLGHAKFYHPGWVYHGLLVGRLRDAALLLHRLLTGALLPPSLLDQMRDAYPLPGPVVGRPWSAPGYGLGLMIGTTTNGRRAIGHTGGGPGSVIAVYHLPDEQPPCTQAAFASGSDQARVENVACRPALP
jgi:CubicO group peptidase (beta-lactamase class C family)